MIEKIKEIVDSGEDYYDLIEFCQNDARDFYIALTVRNLGKRRLEKILIFLRGCFDEDERSAALSVARQLEIALTKELG